MLLSRGQLVAWSLAGLAVLVLGAAYLRGHFSQAQPQAATTIQIGAASTQAKPDVIKIHVVGAVAHPGLYEARSGDRVDDALRLAGGPTAAANLTQVNLAAKISDGQQLFVPEKGSARGGAPSLSSPSSASSKQVVNLNLAAPDELTQLDGIGPKTAEKIIAYREAHGGFKDVEELMQVPGIGQAKFDQIKDRLSV